MWHAIQFVAETANILGKKKGVLRRLGGAVIADHCSWPMEENLPSLKTTVEV